MSKVALVTGGVRGLGAASAVRLARDGYRVIVADLDPVEVSDNPALADAIAGWMKLDVSSLADWRNVVDEVEQRFGSLDILHLNAGVVARPTGQPVEDDPLTWFTEDVLNRMVSVNINGVVNAILAGLPVLRKSRGSIVITASLAGVRGFVSDPLYCMSKHAMVGLTRALGPRLADDGISISAVCPGAMDTRMVPDGVRPLIAMGTPQQVADVVAAVAQRKVASGVWLVPPDGSARLFEIDALAYTQAQAEQGLFTSNG